VRAVLATPLAEGNNGDQETRKASWTAAVLRRLSDGSPKIESHKTPAPNSNWFMEIRSALPGSRINFG
jgi:hypothetical protein